MVGADQKEKKFYPLENEHEFDPANLRSILGKYLDPLPNFEAYTLDTDDRFKFAAIVVTPEQPRPIAVKTSVQGSDGRTELLRRGDIWIKKDTSLDRASHDDLERMYETRIEAQTEYRAQRRFADMQSGLEARYRLQLSPERRIPSDDLVFGPGTEYRTYIEQLLANQDILRFRMLITILRDLLIERWHSIGTFNVEVPLKAEQFKAKCSDHIQNIFNPSVRRLVYTGLLLIKHDFDTDWFERVASLLTEVFEVCGKLRCLPAPCDNVPPGRATKGSVALEVLLSGRVIASYVMRMGHYGHLHALLRKYAVPVGSGAGRKQKPFLFWPLQMNVAGNDRIAYGWQRVVQPYCLEFFGSEESYLDAACQLEFILHLNSYLANEVSEAKQWVSQYRSETDFQYWYTSDLWRYSLEPVVPLAEKIYENLAMGPNAPFLLYLSVEHAAFQKAFQPSEQSLPGYEQQVFIAYLRKLQRWQAQAAHSARSFPHSEPDWGPVLGPRVRGNNG